MTKWIRYCLISIFVLNARIVLSQVLAPGPDRLYVKEYVPEYVKIDLAHPVYLIDDINKNVWCRESDLHPDFKQYIDCILIDSTKLTEKQLDFIAHIKYWREYYATAPLKATGGKYYNPALSGVDRIIGSRRDNLPEAFRFYSVPVKDTIVRDRYTIALRLEISLYKLMEPFYFMQTTVTNVEYREFVDWVRDSIAHRLLSKIDPMMILKDTDKRTGLPLINWKTKIKYDDHIVVELLTDTGFFLPAQERFYQRMEVDSRMVNYMYFTEDSIDTLKKSTYSKWLLKTGQKSTITKRLQNIYPDTLVWVNDFTSDFNEPMKNMYFWHPTFDNYPVVGITKRQAEAFLAWKTEKEQKRLAALGKNDWIVTYELPTENEWEIVEGASKDYNTLSDYTYTYSQSDNDYISDLLFQAPKNTIPFQFHSKVYHNNIAKDTIIAYTAKIDKKDNLFYSWNERTTAFGNYANTFRTSNIRKFRSLKTTHTEYQTVPADFLQCNAIIKKLPYMSSNYDCNGISFMGSNVSEWLQDCYTDFYKPVYDYRHALLEKIRGKDITLQLEIEDYYNATNDSDCHATESYSSLVRGSNWYDDREGGTNGKNTEGMNAKKFVSPDSAYCTLGFRYVIKLRRKDEQKIIDNLKAQLQAAKKE